MRYTGIGLTNRAMQIKIAATAIATAAINR